MRPDVDKLLGAGVGTFEEQFAGGREASAENGDDDKQCEETTEASDGRLNDSANAGSDRLLCAEMLDGVAEARECAEEEFAFFESIPESSLAEELPLMKELLLPVVFKLAAFRCGHNHGGRADEREGQCERNGTVGRKLQNSPPKLTSFGRSAYKNYSADGMRGGSVGYKIGKDGHPIRG
jgi:hypothetical protein